MGKLGCFIYVFDKNRNLPITWRWPAEDFLEKGYNLQKGYDLQEGYDLQGKNFTVTTKFISDDDDTEHDDDDDDDNDANDDDDNDDNDK